MRRDYEVIIVGAGPAGATLAYELASKRIGVLVIEKATLPRYKCCAGGLTVKAAKLLGGNVDAIVEQAISSAIFSFVGDAPHQANYGETVMYTVMRDRFDYALVERAEEAGADVLQGLEALEVRFNGTGVEVSTAAGNFRSQFVAGADGFRSTVARALGLKRGASHIVGIETEVLVADEELAKWKSRVAISLGCIPAGYAWAFPKADHLSVGIGCLASKAKELKHSYWEFVDSLNLGQYTVARWSGSLIPLCTGRAVFTQGRAVLLGDAAGLADPLTGEGIYSAILSAQLAAPAIEKALVYGEAGLCDYQKAVEEKIIPEMRIAHVLSKAFVLFTHRLFRLLKGDERVWRGCCYLLRGETDYSAIRNRVGTLGGLYKFILGK